MASAAVVTAFGMSVAAAPASAASAQPAHTDAPASGGVPTARVILSGAALGLTDPDDVTQLDGKLFTAFQNGVPSTGGTTGTPSQSTVVEFTLGGAVLHKWQVTGKVDGLTADPSRNRLVATVNEDGNSSLYTIPLNGGAPKNYHYDANPLPHGGGTDSVAFYHGKMIISASAPTAGDFGPAVYQVTLVGDTAKLTAAPFYDSSEATVANQSAHGATVSLALTDPDSSTVVPSSSPRFAGDFDLDSQGDQQEIYVSDLGGDNQQLNVLNLSQSVDDSAWATCRNGTLVASDTSGDDIIAITGNLPAGTAYTSVTPAAANSAPSNPGPNWLGSIDLRTGTITPVTVAGPAFQPNGLLFLAGSGQ